MGTGYFNCGLHILVSKVKFMTFSPLLPLPLTIFCSLLILTWIAYSFLRAGRFSWLQLSRALILILVGVLLWGPVRPGNRTTSAHLAVNVFFVVDRTGSMSALDFNNDEPRLVGVRDDLDTITNQLNGSRFSIISWDSTAKRELPLTFDARAVDAWASTLRTEFTYASSGSALTVAHDQLAKALQDSAERHPDSVRLVFFLSDGEDTSGTKASLSVYSDLASLIDGGAVLGYGTTAGGKMLSQSLAIGGSDEYITDPDTGEIALSMLNEQSLQELAQALGVSFEVRENSATPISVLQTLNYDDLIETAAAKQTVYDFWGWPFAAGIVVLLLFEAGNLGRLSARKVGVSK